MRTGSSARSVLSMRETLSAPGLTVSDSVDPEVFAAGPDGARTNQSPLAPLSEQRVMIADRAADTFAPGSHYANDDPQKGGAPGAPGSLITSQSPDGVTTVGAAPVSPRKLSYGLGDWQIAVPTFVGAHLKINRNANPNRPQVNTRPWNLEGPQGNTRYSTPSPFAQGEYIG